MCTATAAPAGYVDVETAEQMKANQRRKNALRPTKREETALEIDSPEGQKGRQALAARMGVSQLRAPLVNYYR